MNSTDSWRILNPNEGTIPFVVAVVAIIFIIIRRVYRNARQQSSSRPSNMRYGGGPIISSYQMLSDNNLTSMHKDVLEGFSYNFLTNSKGNVMALVDLQNDTNLHMIAIGDKSQLDPLISAQVSFGSLEPVVLEGDFPSYFRVYVTPGEQSRVRQIMEPRNMAQFVDFCRAYSIEVHNKSLYISHVPQANDHQDSTTMMEDLKLFLQKNGQMLQRL